MALRAPACNRGTPCATACDTPISQDAGNALELRPDGLFVAPGDPGPAGADSIVPGPPGDPGPPGADSTVPGPQGDPGPASTYVAGDGLTESPAGTFNVGTAEASRIQVNANDIDLGTPVIANWALGVFYTKVAFDQYGRALDVQQAVPADIGAEPAFAGGTTAKYYRGDKTWQILNKNAVGLANVDNTTDATKPVSAAQAAAIAAVAAAIPATTDALTEGAFNLYFTNSRAVAALAGALSTKQTIFAPVTAASGDITPALDTSNVTVRTALAAAVTINNPTGTKIEGKEHVLRLRDNGTLRAITWDSEYRSMSVALPATTTANKTVWLFFRANAAETTMDLVSVALQP
jgi:hypothetical protein